MLAKSLWSARTASFVGMAFLVSCSGDVSSDNGSGAYLDESYADYYPGTEKSEPYTIIGFLNPAEDSLSTFGVDVDGASYTFARAKLNQSVLPDPTAIRVEEFINYFAQDYTPPTSAPFSVQVDGAPSLFRGDSIQVLRVGLQGKAPTDADRPWNLTFLVDISGSMSSRIDLVKQSLSLLVDQMRSGDRLSIGTYAGSVGTVLEPTTLADKDKNAIKAIIADLYAGGSTAMEDGLQNAYRLNRAGHLENGVNRVIVCSDGDANVGSTSYSAILDSIGKEAREGIYLTTLGFGEGNYNDQMMEQLADKGNGNYYYIDSEAEAERLFSEDLLSVMEVIAKNVKIQVEFHADAVSAYRLIGYENRSISDSAFTADTTDAGEIGAGHRVTALYELKLKSGDRPIGTVHLRYQEPNGNTDIPLDVEIKRSAFAATAGAASARFRFTEVVSEFAEVLRGSPYATSTISSLVSPLQASYDASDNKDAELLELVRKAAALRD